MAFGARPTAGNEMRRMGLAVLPEPVAEGVYSSPEIARASRELPAGPRVNKASIKHKPGSF
jgi:hypothetical protein